MVNIEGENIKKEKKSSYLLNDLKNFNEIFRKNVAYYDIKSDEKTRFHLFSSKQIFAKTKRVGRGRGQINSPRHQPF